MTLKRTALRESLRPWFALVGLVVPVNLMMALDKNSFALAAPRIGQSLGLDYVHVSLVIAALSWSYAIMQLPSGWLVHRLGPRRSLGGRLSALVPDDRNHAGIRLATLSVRVRLSWRHPERRVAASFPRRSVSAPGRVTLTVSRYARPAPIGWIGGLLGHRGGDLCMLAVQSFYHVTLPQYLLSARHLSYQEMGWVFSLPWFCLYGSVVASGFISDRIYARTASVFRARVLFGALGATTSAVCLEAASLCHSILTSVALLCAAFAALGPCQVSIWTLAQGLTRHHAAVVVGWAGFCSNLAAGIVPVLTAHLLKTGLNWPEALLLPCVLGVLEAVCCLLTGYFGQIDECQDMSFSRNISKESYDV